MCFEIVDLGYDRPYWFFTLRFFLSDGLETETRGCRYLEEAFGEAAIFYGRVKMNPPLYKLVLSELVKEIELKKERKPQCSLKLIL